MNVRVVSWILNLFINLITDKISHLNQEILFGWKCPTFSRQNKNV